MITCLVALICSSPSITATVDWKNQTPIIEVTSRGKKTILRDQSFAGSPPDSPSFRSQIGMNFKGIKYLPVGGELVNTKTKERLAIPHDNAPAYEGLYAPMFRCKGAVDLGGSMLWCWSWDNMDVSLDPPVAFYAIEIGLEKGRMIVRRSTQLPEVTGIGAGIVFHRKNIVLFRSMDRLITFNTKSWTQIASVEGNLLETNSGKLFRQEKKGEVSLWSPSNGKWTHRTKKLPPIQSVISLSTNEIFSFEKGFFSLTANKTYLLPLPKTGHGYQTLVVSDPKFGLGVLWIYPTQTKTSDTGVILSPKTMATLCAIRPKSPSAWRP